MSVQIGPNSTLDIIYINITLTNNGWRPVNMLLPKDLHGFETGPFDIIVLDANNNRISDMRNELNLSQASEIRELKSNHFREFYIQLFNIETKPWFNDIGLRNVPIINNTNSTGPYSIYVIYDTTDYEGDVWKGTLESEIYYLPD